jgi:hypothetical protein
MDLKDTQDQKWISFDDEMPKNNTYIDVKSDDYWHGSGIFQDGKFVYSWVKGACFGSPTHWKTRKIRDE